MRNTFSVLSKSDMKHIMGGGNIYCSIGGQQSQFNNFSLLDAIETCVAVAEANGTTCGGCGEFPDAELKEAP
jgi:hypothetical protein